MKCIKNAKIYTMDELGTLECGDILIENGKIKAIGKSLDSNGAEVIDATGLIAIPGMVDAHSHIGGFDLMRNDQDVNEMVKNVTAEVEITDGIDPNSPMFDEALASGITCSAIAPGSGNVIGGMVSAIKSYGKTMDEKILKKEIALKAAMGGNPKGVYGTRNQMPMTRMGVASVLRQYFRDVQEYMKKQEEAKDDLDKMPKFDAGLENGAKVLRKEIPLKVHCTQFDMITVINLAKEFDFNFTLDHAWGASRYMEQLVNANCPILFGPVAVAKGFGESLIVDIESTVELDRKGVKCSIITDGPVYHPWSILTQAREVARAGLENERILRMLTINPAEAMLCDDRIGSLKVGKDADIVLFHGEPVMDLNSYVEMTLCNGQVVYKNERSFIK